MYQIQTMNDAGQWVTLSATYATRDAAERVAAAVVCLTRVVWGPEQLAALRRQLGINN
jgi:hypothetical protein